MMNSSKISVEVTYYELVLTYMAPAIPDNLKRKSEKPLFHRSKQYLPLLHEQRVSRQILKPKEAAATIPTSITQRSSPFPATSSFSVINPRLAIAVLCLLVAS